MDAALGPSHARVVKSRQQLSTLTILLALAPAPAQGQQIHSPSGVIRRSAVRVRQLAQPLRRKVGGLTVELRPDPLTIAVRRSDGSPVQQIVFQPDGAFCS